jgi:Mg/Co/Ni transporter MgtE
MTRPLVEILRDLNKHVPDKIIDPDTNTVNKHLAQCTPYKENLQAGHINTDLLNIVLDHNRK